MAERPGPFTEHRSIKILHQSDRRLSFAPYRHIFLSRVVTTHVPDEIILTAMTVVHAHFTCPCPPALDQQRDTLSQYGAQRVGASPNEAALTTAPISRFLAASLARNLDLRSTSVAAKVTPAGTVDSS